MQTFPQLCIYNFGLPRRTPSPWPPTPRDFSTLVRPPCRARPPSLTRTTNAAWAGRRLARRPGLGGNWRRLAHTTYVKMARKEKNTRARSVKKNLGVGSTLYLQSHLEMLYFILLPPVRFTLVRCIATSIARNQAPTLSIHTANFFPTRKWGLNEDLGYGPHVHKVLFRYEKFLDFATVTLSFVYSKYCPIMN